YKRKDNYFFGWEETYPIEYIETRYACQHYIKTQPIFFGAFYASNFVNKPFLQRPQANKKQPSRFLQNIRKTKQMPSETTF
ncbi:TPA: hypothetical protein ACFJAF_001868, partial [Neisseria gonorrhoeae]